MGVPHIRAVSFVVVRIRIGHSNGTGSDTCLRDECVRHCSVVDTTNNAVIATIPVGIFPSGVAITPNGTSAYVANIFNSISVIDATTNRVVVTIPSGQFPTGIAITPDGTRAYVVNQIVTNQGNNTVSVIDTMTNTIVATISVGLRSFSR